MGGVAYSILYTSFESWLIAEADACGAGRSVLSRLFSVAIVSIAVESMIIVSKTMIIVRAQWLFTMVLLIAILLSRLFSVATFCNTQP